MSNYPRKNLNYKSPLEAVLDELDDKSILNKIYKLQEQNKFKYYNYTNV